MLTTLILVAASFGVILLIKRLGIASSGTAGVPNPDILAETTEVTLELCLAVTGQQIREGRSQTGTELASLAAEFDPGIEGAEGSLCLPESGGNFSGTAVPVRVSARAVQGGSGFHSVDSGEYEVSSTRLKDRLLLYYVLASFREEGFLEYRFDVDPDSGLSRCGDQAAPTIHSKSARHTVVLHLCR